jgi:argininosuccinate lyase
VPSGNAKSPQYLWQKGGNANIDIRLMAMMSEEDVHLDQQIFLYDIEASKAHVQGLERIKLIGQKESKVGKIHFQLLSQKLNVNSKNIR